MIELRETQWLAMAIILMAWLIENIEFHRRSGGGYQRQCFIISGNFSLDGRGQISSFIEKTASVDERDVTK